MDTRAVYSVSPPRISTNDILLEYIVRRRSNLSYLVSPLKVIQREDAIENKGVFVRRALLHTHRVYRLFLSISQYFLFHVTFFEALPNSPTPRFVLTQKLFHTGESSGDTMYLISRIFLEL